MEQMDIIFKILYIVFCVFQILWVIYDIINFIVKRLTYNIVEAEVWQHVKGRIQERREPTTYHTQLKYSYNNKVNYYTTKWERDCLLPKVGTLKKLYINKNDSSKIYFFDFKHFIAFTLFRLVFTIPLIKSIIK